MACGASGARRSWAPPGQVLVGTEGCFNFATVSVTYCYVTSYPQTQGKTETTYLLTILKMSQLGSSGLVLPETVNAVASGLHNPRWPHSHV